MFSEDRCQERETHGSGCAEPHDPLSDGVGCLYLLLSDEMTDEDGASLGDRKGEDVCEHHDVDDIASGRKSLVADHVDEI